VAPTRIKLTQMHAKFWPVYLKEELTWEANIKTGTTTNSKRDCIHLVQMLVNVVMNLWVLQTVGNSSNSLSTINFSRTFQSVSQTKNLTCTAIPCYNAVSLALISYYAAIAFQLFLDRVHLPPTVTLFPLSFNL
jgi:hypothetical protein